MLPIRTCVAISQSSTRAFTAATHSKELVELNGTVSEPKRYTLVVDVQTMQARREERSHDNERSQITLYNATTQLVLIPRGASDYDCIKLHIPSDNSTEPFSYAIVDDSAVLVDKNATLPPLGPRSAAAMLAAKGAPPRDGGAIELWAHNRTYSGGVVQLLEWYLEERVVPGRVAASLRSASSSGRAGDDADWRSTAATSAAGSVSAPPSRELRSSPFLFTVTF